MNFVISQLFYFWMIIAVLFLLLEMGNPGLFFFLSFFCGALFSAGVTFFTESLVLQLCVFFVGTKIALYVLRYYVVPAIGMNRPNERTNVYALIGKKAIVTQKIYDTKPGFVKIDGILWVARSVHQEEIEENTHVEVVDVRGAHAIVRKV